MKFIKKIDKNRYETFLKNNKKCHFLQSYAWGQFAKKEKNFEPLYVGMEDDKGKLVATALILKKQLPFNLSYFYIPRGFILDYEDKDLLEQFTNSLKLYAKNHNSIFIKIDPDIVYNEEDNLGNSIIKNDRHIIDNLMKLGYRHLGFTKNFETMQPRYTFRIDFRRDFSEILNNFSKTTNQRIKKANDLSTFVEIGTEKDIKTFFELMTITEKRKNFITHNEQYYKSLYEIWNKDNSCNIFLGKINIDNTVKILNKKKTCLLQDLKSFPLDSLSKSQKSKKAELEKHLEKIQEDIVKYNDIKNEYGNEIILSAHFIIEYGNTAWVLYAGNHNILTDTYVNYKTYLTHIKYYYDKSIKVYDQFGTIGDLRKSNPLLGLHEFKKKFGGNYIEFIGEFDLVTNKFMYFFYTKVIPIYHKIILKISKKKRGNK